MAVIDLQLVEVSGGLRFGKAKTRHRLHQVETDDAAVY
jgi:hypothetical protein